MDMRPGDRDWVAREGRQAPSDYRVHRWQSSESGETGQACVTLYTLEVLRAAHSVGSGLCQGTGRNQRGTCTSTVALGREGSRGYLATVGAI